MKSNYSKQENKQILDAVWQWVLDHSDIDESGVLFLKAHIKDKAGFAKSIRFRMKGNYRSFITDDLIIERRQEHLEKSGIGEAIRIVAEENRKILSNNRKWWQRLFRLN